MKGPIVDSNTRSLFLPAAPCTGSALADTARVRSCAGAARMRRVAPLTRFLLAVVAALALLSSVTGTAAATEAPICAPTGNEDVVTSEPRYPQGGVAEINGSGYAADCVVSVRVTWPDGSVQTGDGSGTAGSDWVQTDSVGGFSYLYQLRNVGGEYTVEVLGENGVVLAQTTFEDAATVSTLKLGNAAGPENYIYTAGDTIHAQGSVDATRFYRWFVINSAGTTINSTSCAGPIVAGSTSVSHNYTVQASDTESGSVPYTFQLRQYTTNTCLTQTSPASQATDQKFFAVAKAETFSDPTLTTPASIFSVATQAYLRIKGLRNAGQQNPINAANDWQVTWIKPDGTTACANTAGNDRPDSSNTGLLPTGGSDGYLKYQPNATATGDAWNRQSNYDGACPAFATDNTGTWKLKLQQSATFFVTIPVFTVTCTAPAVTQDPADESITYGDNAVFTASATGAPSPTVQWEVSTDGGFNWSPIGGATSTTLTVTAPSVADSGNLYRAVFTNSCGGTATATTDEAALTVDKKAVDVTAETETVTYGDPEPAIDCTFDASDFVLGQNSSVIDSNPSGDTTYDQGDEVGDGELTGGNAGKYRTFCQNGSDDNYSFNFTDGTLTVDKKAVDVTAETETVTYGDPEPAIDCTFDASDFVLGQNSSVIDSNPSGDTTYDQGDEVGDGELRAGTRASTGRSVRTGRMTTTRSTSPTAR